ncbi:uncharacterized protein FOMMEDRAFT_83934 [Fomitiporia mediterranea MF3/22]|uniref:uncharacterized protein n=1 Tax=Fomitiporia mediterranea (strain MF3/22) TaxID=694068 RepID=UPI0004407BAF|nr:uncharacterized protein FOMMEDRAFT_83934 [Fomitiporia mediterranea MF3/22]EJD04323.1 hypothetical protein FOMMEDRAFT_83934 [Fomitiporia mediterranea MF3/22]
MFSCCDSEEEGNEKAECMDIYESAKDIEILVRLLHDPPQTLPETKPLKRSAMEPNIHYKPAPTQTAIPHPLLPRLFALADKYLFNPPITKVLHSHLSAQTPTAPLLVYGLATGHSLREIADKASTFLASTPLSSFTSKEIKIIPTAEALHNLLLLQTHRQLKFKELLMKEELFPHGYGVCDAHKVHVESLWETTRQAILPDVHSGEIESLK